MSPLPCSSDMLVHFGDEPAPLVDSTVQIVPDCVQVTGKGVSDFGRNDAAA